MATTAGAPATGPTIQIAASHAIEMTACDNGTYDVSGSYDVITLTGNCTAVDESGNYDNVIVGSVTRASLSGSNDNLAYHTGTPTVSKAGPNDVVVPG